VNLADANFIDFIVAYDGSKGDSTLKLKARICCNFNIRRNSLIGVNINPSY
jgi:hypothetical protein